MSEYKSNMEIEYLKEEYIKSQYYIKHLKMDIELQYRELVCLQHKVNLYKKMITPDVLKKCPELLEYLI
jgi:hypothetical protein